MSSPRNLLIYTFLITLGCIASLFVLPNELLLDRLTYYLLWISTIVLLSLIFKKFSIYNYKKIKSSSQTKKVIIIHYFIPFFYALTLTSMIFVAVECDFRVLADETNLLNVSQSFLLNKRFFHPIETDISLDRIIVLSGSIPHRPGLWPFFVHFIHILLGYKATNAFILNFIVSVFCLYFLFISVKRIFNSNIAFVASGLLASYPLYQMNVTSGGFDPINMLFHIVVFWRLFEFLKRSSGLNLEICIVSAILGSQARYETAVLFIPITIAYFLKKRNVWRDQLYYICYMPILAMPIVWQRYLSRELTNQGDSGKDAFVGNLIIPHLYNAIEFFSSFNSLPDLPTIPFVLYFSIIGLVLLLFFNIRIKKFKSEHKYTLGLSMLSIAIISIIHFAYYLGDYRLPFIMRYGLVQTYYMSIFASVAIVNLFTILRISKWIYIFVFFLFFYYTPVTIDNQKGASLDLYREFKKTRNYLNQYADKRSLIISDRPGMYTSLGFPSVNYPYTNNNYEFIAECIKLKIYTEVFIIQHVMYKNLEPKEYLDPKFKILSSYEFQENSDGYVRISKMIKE